MSRSKLRRQIAWQAARLMYWREESEYYRAKMKAARACQKGWVKPADLPSNAEIRDEILAFAAVHEGERQRESLREMRIEALRLMRILRRFHPRLIGSVLTGHVRHGSDIDLHVFSDSVESVRAELDYHGIPNELVEKRVVKDQQRRVFRHLLVKDRFPFELTVYPKSQLNEVFKSSITGKPIERASIAELEQFLLAEYPHIDLEAELTDVESKVDRFQVYYALLLPLENVQQSPKYHPEGDALYHSLQVFELVRDQRPYDEELLLAALLHDVGKAIDPYDHVAAGLQALQEVITERTAWLIGHHMEAHKVIERTIGARARKRLESHEDFEDLVLLAECDRAGRVPGAETSELEEALEYLREIADSFG